MSMSRLLLKKSVARIQEESMQSPLKRTLGKWNLVSLGIGCIIGAGIFVMTGTAAAKYAGPAIILSFVIAGLACAFAGLCYAELASVLPVSGSAYTYAYATLGEFSAWIMGWLLVLEYGLASSTVAVGWSGYVVNFLLDFGIVIPPKFTAPLGAEISVSSIYRDLFTAQGYGVAESVSGSTVKLLTASGDALRGVFNAPAFVGIIGVVSLLVVGVSESAKVNNVIVAIKLLVVLAFVCIGVFYIDIGNWTPFIPANEGTLGKYGVSGIFRAASVIFFAYVGFEAVSTAAAEAKDPQRDMPFGIIGSLVVCTILYMLVSGVLTGVIHFTELNVADPMAVAVNKIGLPWFAFLIKIGAITGLSSVMLVLVYGQTRIFYTMARDGLLPPMFSRIHPRFRTPHLNTMAVGLVVAIAAALTPIDLLGDLVSIGTLSAFCIVCISVLYLRKKEPGLVRPFRTPFMPVTPILGIISCSALIFSIFAFADPNQKTGHFMLWFLLGGLAIYFFYGKRHSRLAQGLPPLTGDESFVSHEHEPQTD